MDTSVKRKKEGYDEEESDSEHEYKLRCTRPPQSQSGAIFSPKSSLCCVKKSARQVWTKITERHKN